MSTKKAAAPKRSARPSRSQAAAPARPARPAAKAAAAPKAAVRTAPKPALKRQLDDALGKVRETSRDNLLMGLGALSKARRERDDRMAELIAEGQRIEPKVRKAVDDLKARWQPKGAARLDLGKLKLDKLELGRFKLDKLGLRKLEMPKFEMPKFELPKLDLAKFKVDAKAFDRAAIRERFEQRMTESLHRIGLPTRKEVQALARKVDKLAAQQA